MLYFFANLDVSRFGFHLLTHMELVVAFGYFGHFLAGVSPHMAVVGAAQLFFIFFNVIMVSLPHKAATITASPNEQNRRRINDLY